MRHLLFSSTAISTGLLLFSLNLAASQGIPSLSAAVQGSKQGELFVFDVEVEKTAREESKQERAGIKAALEESKALRAPRVEAEEREGKESVEEVSTAPSASDTAIAADIMAVRNVGNIIRTRISNRSDFCQARQPDNNQQVVNNCADDANTRQRQNDAASFQALWYDLGYDLADGYNEAAEDVALGAEIWMQGFGGTAKISDAGFSTDKTNGGVLFGVDNYVSDNMAIGVAGAFTKSNSTTSGLGGLTGANSTTYGAIGYLGYNWDNGLDFNASAGYLRSEVNQSRRDSRGDVYSSDFASNTMYVNSNIARDYLVNDIVFTPTIGLALTKINYAGYTETTTGAGILAQTVSDRNVTSVVGLTGINIAKKIELDGKSVTLNLGGELLYEFNDTLGHYSTSITNNNDLLKLDPNNIHTTDPLLANIGGSVDIDFSKTASTQLGYSATFGKRTTEHNINGRFSIKF